MNIRFPLIFLLVVPLKLAQAATYYVDSTAGNDLWTGKIATPNGAPATDGPWLTLNKVSSASLLPGDTVLLKCGQTWNQTLSVTRSGTTSSPITFATYPTTCTTAPQINGATAIPALSWVQHSGNIYKASLPFTLLNNGTYNANYDGWITWSQANDAKLALTPDCMNAGNNCLSVTSGTGVALATSNVFSLAAGQTYKLSVAINIPSGKSIRMFVRRNSSPWNSLGLETRISGNGTWQTYSIPFKATASLTNARLDFELPAGMKISLDDVRVETSLNTVTGVFDNGRAVNVAHHPNRGYNPAQPDSPYLSNAQDSAIVVQNGISGSSYITVGTDLKLPAGATLSTGTGIVIRTNNTIIDARKIASVSGTRINLDQPTGHPVYKDWGYYLVDQLWMLDEPGEFFFDAASKTVYVWMSDSQAPGTRVSVGQLDAGINLAGVSNAIVDGIAIRNAHTGVRMNKSSYLTLRNLIIEDVLGMGINATHTSMSEIGTSRIARTGQSAISGDDHGYSLSGFSIHDNEISDSGVRFDGNKITSLPADVIAAIKPGYSATITRNTLRNTAYSGIFPLKNSVISENHIENACLVLDDGAAIQMQGANHNTLVDHNTILHVLGSTVGKPANAFTLAQGIYLDATTTGVTVRNNSVIDAYDGIHIHDAAYNVIENNSLYGNRRYQLWMQEDTNLTQASGDVYGNVVTGNLFFPTSTIPSVRQDTLFGSTHAAASYDKNQHFTFGLPSMASESSSAGLNTYDFLKWQKLTTSSGVPRNLDPLGGEINSSTIGYASYRVTGSNIVPNGNLSNGLIGWSTWNLTSPYGTTSLVGCKPGKCLNYAAGGSQGLVSSPNFSVVKGQWYRLSFDLQGSVANQKFTAIVRRGGGGGNSYDNIMVPQTFAAGTTLQRYSLVFQSTLTINAKDPITGDNGARVDFDGTKPGQSITLTNVELVPTSPFAPTLRTSVLLNPTASILTFNCPLSGADATYCDQFLRFGDGQPVIWPYPLDPHDSAIIYTANRDGTLTDADRDGIPDSQDSCSSTAIGNSVSAKGCAYSQSYP